MNDEEFEQLVRDGIQAIPQHFREALNNVSIVVEEQPSQEQKKRFNLYGGRTLFGLYEGVPQTERGSGYGLVPPDKITIFKKPILNASTDPEDVRKLVADTVWHEIGHHFGIGENDIRNRQSNRDRNG